jgi:hypothetical protein
MKLCISLPVWNYLSLDLYETPHLFISLSLWNSSQLHTSSSLYPFKILYLPSPLEFFISYLYLLTRLHFFISLKFSVSSSHYLFETLYLVIFLKLFLHHLQNNLSCLHFQYFFILLFFLKLFISLSFQNSLFSHLFRTRSLFIIHYLSFSLFLQITLSCSPLSNCLSHYLFENTSYLIKTLISLGFINPLPCLLLWNFISCYFIKTLIMLSLL